LNCGNYQQKEDFSYKNLNIGLTINDNSNLVLLEPFFNKINLGTVPQDYIDAEQPTTRYNLKSKFENYDDVDVMVKLTSVLTQEDFNNIMLPCSGCQINYDDILNNKIENDGFTLNENYSWDSSSCGTFIPLYNTIYSPSVSRSNSSQEEEAPERREEERPWEGMPTPWDGGGKKTNKSGQNKTKTNKSRQNKTKKIKKSKKSKTRKTKGKKRHNSRKLR
jgi:hypothetical protein